MRAPQREAHAARPSERPWRRARQERQWRHVLWSSLGAAALLHALLLFGWPQARVSTEFRTQVAMASLIELPRMVETDAPRPPGHIPAPALPVAGAPELQLEEAAEVPMPTFEELPWVDIPPPPTAVEDRWASYQHFAPSMVRPEVRNRGEMQDFLRVRYTPVLNRTGATGVARVHFWIDESGKVQRAELAASSGHRVLDDLAMEISDLVVFRPAVRQGDPVRVQIVLPITFRDLAE